ncbi:hypothetical protein [Burkholderia sp. PU8-34]
MEDSLHIAEPVALVGTHGAHGMEAFDSKLMRRLTLYCRCVFDQWVVIESDPKIRALCKLSGFIKFAIWVSCIECQ